jgi:hypothetical protein
MKTSEPKTGPKKQTSARELREQKRAQEEKQRRMLYVGIGAAVVLVLGVIAYLIATAPRPAPIEGVQIYPGIPGGQHAEGPIGYTQTPPVGGPHNPNWQNCGIYDRAVQSEYAVHSLEHGAVWITYDPDLPADQLEMLRNIARGQRLVLLSPFAGLPTPVVASAWGAQLQLPNASDPRLAEFVTKYQNSPLAPEPNAPCTGGIGSPVG